MFFLSADDKLLVKTIRKAEFDLLRRLLPAYYSHMLAHPNSLLVRVYGAFSITSASSGGRKVGASRRLSFICENAYVWLALLAAWGGGLAVCWLARHMGLGREGRSLSDAAWPGIAGAPRPLLVRCCSWPRP